MQEQCLRPGLWEIGGFVVRRARLTESPDDESGRVWLIQRDESSPPVTVVQSLDEARDWIDGQRRGRG